MTINPLKANCSLVDLHSGLKGSLVFSSLLFMCLKTRNEKKIFELLEGSDPKSSTEDMDEEIGQRREIRKAGGP